MIIAVFGVVIMVRIMVNMFFEIFRHIFMLNHIQLPEPGWQLEIVKFLLTVMISSPIVGFMAAVKP